MGSNDNFWIVPGGDNLRESPNKVFKFYMQDNGNLVLKLFDDSITYWQTGTWGHPGAGVAMQADGNMVIYYNGGPIWATNTVGGPSNLQVQDDGNLVIYRNGGGPVWASNTTKSQDFVAPFAKKYHDTVYCMKGTNMLTDESCTSQDVYNGQHVSDTCSDPTAFLTEPCSKFCDAQISGNLPYDGPCLKSYENYCSIPANFKSQKCMNFCNQQVNSSGISSSICFNGAGSYCSAKSNFYDPECACINYEGSPDYLDYIDKFSTLKGVSSQCWSAPCAKATANWSDLMSSVNRTGTGSGVCPSQLQICDQTMNVSDIKTQSLGSISQTCDLNANKSTTNVTLPPGSITPPSGSTTPPSVASFFSRLSSGSGSTSSNTATYVGIGGLSFCSSLCCLLFVVLIFFMMRK
jgi:hypothetical protein